MDDCKMGNELDIINFLNLYKSIKFNRKLFKREGPLASRTKDFVTQKVTDNSDSKGKGAEDKESKKLSNKKLALLNLINYTNLYNFFDKKKSGKIAEALEKDLIG